MAFPFEPLLFTSEGRNGFHLRSVCPACILPMVPISAPATRPVVVWLVEVYGEIWGLGPLGTSYHMRAHWRMSQSPVNSTYVPTYVASKLEGER
jgi:hypothetical protein